MNATLDRPVLAKCDVRGCRWNGAPLPEHARTQTHEAVTWRNAEVKEGAELPTRYMFIFICFFLDGLIFLTEWWNSRNERHIDGFLVGCNATFLGPSFTHGDQFQHVLQGWGKHLAERGNEGPWHSSFPRVFRSGLLYTSVCVEEWRHFGLCSCLQTQSVMLI